MSRLLKLVKTCINVKKKNCKFENLFIIIQIGDRVRDGTGDGDGVYMYIVQIIVDCNTLMIYLYFRISLHYFANVSLVLGITNDTS